MIRIEGQFARGDAVMVRGPDTHEIGRGLVAYDAEDAEKIKGGYSWPDVMAILGISGRAEMIHRDDLVVGPAGVIPAQKKVGHWPSCSCRWPPASHAGSGPRKSGISVLGHGLNPDMRPPMSAPLKAIDGTADLPALMTDLAAQARAAARVLALAPPEQKDRALEAIERAIRAKRKDPGGQCRGRAKGAPAARPRPSSIA